jgi:pimeloyl-ACP methyl ester carboxylesterase
MLLALVHSPLVGPLTWTRLAAVLGARGLPVVLPELRDDPADPRPFWQQHAAAAAADLQRLAPDQPLVLVAHSGAGALLPAIRQALGRPVAGYVLIDAGWPVAGQTRLEMFGDEAASFRAFLAAGGRFPNWTRADLQEIVPDPELAERLIAGQRPRALPFWEEPIPVFAGWPDAPGAFLLFTETYRASAGQACARGWPVRELPAGHFHMLVEPQAVAEALLELLRLAGVNSAA